MNIPLKDRTWEDNELALEEALNTCRGLTQPVRTAMVRCKVNDSSSVRSRELIAAAHIVCTPGELLCEYAGRIRGDLPTTEAERAVAKGYSLMAIAAMRAIISRMGNSGREEKVRAEYLVAIGAEKERVKALARQCVAT